MTHPKNYLQSISLSSSLKTKHFQKRYQPNTLINKSRTYWILEVFWSKCAVPIANFFSKQKHCVNEMAVHKTYILENSHILHLLIKKGAKLSIKKTCGQFTFHHVYRLLRHLKMDGAVEPNLKIIQLFLSERVEINVGHETKNESFFYACQKTFYAVVGVLVKSGIDLNNRNIDSLSLYCEPCTAIDDSMWESFLELLINLNMHIDFKHIPSLCLYTSNTLNQKLLRSSSLKIEESAYLLYAAVMCRKETLFLFLIKDYNVDPNFADAHYAGKLVSPSPLYFAVFPLIIECVLGRLHSALESLANVPYNINIKDGFGNTALHYAIMEYDEVSLKLLVNHDCDVNCENNIGDTPLLLSVSCLRYEMIEILIAYGANVNIQAKDGSTFIKYITDTDLRQSGNSPESFMYNNIYPRYDRCQILEVVKLVLRSGYQVNQFSLENHFSFINGDNEFTPEFVDILRLLLKAGYDISQDSSIQPTDKFLSLIPKNILESNRNFFDWLIFLSQPAPTLLELSARIIRKHIERKNINKLTVPESLKRYLMFEEV